MTERFVFEPGAAGALPPGVSLKRGSWWDDYVGPTDSVLRLGLITADMLPDVEAGKSRMATFYAGQRLKRGDTTHRRGPGWLRIIRRVSGRGRDSTSITVGLPQDEEERRRAMDRARIEEEREQHRKVTDAFKSPDEYREMLSSFLLVLNSHLGGHRGCAPYEYALADDTAASVQYALGILQEAIEGGRIVVADRALASLVAARANGQLQSFLRQVQSKP